MPGLGQLPILGRLFSDHNGDHTKTEIVLQVTPHIIRPQLAADADTREVWSGTEGNVRTEQLRLDPTSIASTGTLNAPVVPGNVGGGTVGGSMTPGGAAASASSQSAVPPTGSFGQPAAEPRTTPPPAPFGGRYSTVPVVPPPAATVAPVAPPAADAASVDGTGAPPAAPPTTLVLPVQIVPATPAPILQMPPNDMPSDNPLHPINGGY